MPQTAKIVINPAAAQPSSATDVGGALVAALAERNFTRFADTLTPDLSMRALIPPGLIELLGAETAAERFSAWFGSVDELYLVQSGSDEVGDRLHVFYRFRVKRTGDSWKTIEQHLFCAVAGGRITALDLVCSGFRPEAADKHPPIRTRPLPELTPTRGKRRKA
jgi:hypothetical protein